MSDPFSKRAASLTSPFEFAEPISPDDNADLPSSTRAVFVGAQGDLRVTTVGGSVVTFRNHPVGYMPGRVRRVHLTGTTADWLVAVW